MNAARATFGLAVATAMACCVADQPQGTGGFDESAGTVEVTLGGDGFVQCAGERLPFDAFVLRLRQRTRAMTREQLDRFVVYIQVARDIPAGDAEKAANASKARLLSELQVMGVVWAKYMYPARGDG